MAERRLQPVSECTLGRWSGSVKGVRHERFTAAQGGENVLQAIRAKRASAEATGTILLDLSIGEPKGPALLSARRAAANAVMSDEEAMHAYQYNASPGVPGFSQRFVQVHVDRTFSDSEVDYLPIPGVKPMLGLVPLFTMIEETGVVGVHFPGYVRYAVCGDVEAMSEGIEAAFARAQVSYD